MSIERKQEELKRTDIAELINSDQINVKVNVKGWVRTRRQSKNVAFIALNDGSTINNIQLVAEVNNVGEALLSKINTGAAISVNGLLVESTGSGQSREIQVESVELLGPADPDEYPLQPKRHSLEFLRERPTCDSEHLLSVPSQGSGMP